MPTLQFKGKTFVQNHHLAVKYHQLVPKKELSLTDKVSLHDNLIIQGDNLKALKALLPTYAGKIKCIYIDPPYNTGNEKWVYNDNVNSPMIKEWLGKEVDIEDMTRHDKWLCMMLPRLKLLRELLSEDGAIFISCDDNEQHNLRCLIDEVFGENNFLGMFIINSSPSAIDYGHIASQHEYALFFAKNIEKVTANQLSEKDKEFSYEDEIGPFNLYPLYNGNVAFNPKTRPNLYYPFYLNPQEKGKNGFFEIDIEQHKGWVEVLPVISQKEGIPRVWRWGKEKSRENLNKEIVGHITSSGEFRIVQKTRHTSKVIRSLQIDNEVSSRRGTGEVEEIFGNKEFTFPKPIELIKRFVEISTDKDSIILDSFAGSGTTAHAVLTLNKDDGGTRKFILVEQEDYANTITAERVRRVIKGVKTAKSETLQKGLGGTFSYFELGPTIEMESILQGKNLPSYEEFARYIFYTATGEEFNENKINEKAGFIGETKNYELYMFYKPDVEWLKRNALTLDGVKAMPKFKGKQRLVFAPAKYVDDETCRDNRIDFCQLPYEIYRIQKMRLKHYQEKVIKALKDYLGELDIARNEYEEMLAIKPNLAKHINFPKDAWEKSTSKTIYHTKTNSLNEPLPDIYLKVPTGGGKTLLACHSIDLIQKSYLKKQTGLILWIVPSTQIYRQTILALKDREHPYRQILDISSGGRTLIKEKTEMFNRLDVEENLMVLMLMLPSANRQNKETLKVFRDAGGYTDFFPPEDNYLAQEELLKKITNLDCFGDDGEVFQKQIKTSLGNTLKVLQPLVVIDEGHRAYGENARNTVRNFNPSFILELSATPPEGSNELVKITGRELHEEEMIKLDIHLNNKLSLDWKNTMLASFEKQNQLEKLAKEYEENTGEYIRPICLIQVERTGKDQRGSDFIHAEDAKEYLIKQCNVPETHIAIKSSEKDDIEGIDLFSKSCDIRYIITKQALQEGWDCSFAYILTILTNPGSSTGITQLVGRILRQPKAIKTKIKELDECYIFTFKPNASTLVKEIKKGLEEEGLGDIAGRLINDEGGEEIDNLKDREIQYRPGFKKFEGKIYLPKFVIQEKDSWRDLIFEVDILSEIDWTKINISEIANKTLTNKKNKEQELTLGLSKEQTELLQETGRLETKGTLEIDEAFLARQISEIVPNPWICYNLGDQAIKLLSKKYDRETIASNFVFIIEELKKILEKQKNIFAESVFKALVNKKRLHFFLISNKGGFVLPSRIKVKSNKQLIRNDNTPIQKSLFDYVPEENINELEKSVAIYLDEQEKLLWWYRNMSRQDYHIQGWKKNKIYPDFVATNKSTSKKEDYDTVFVLETKGVHLAGNEDTRYKQDVFALCNELGAKKAWKELFDEFPDHDFEFQVIHGDEWQNKVNKLFN